MKKIYIVNDLVKKDYILKNKDEKVLTKKEFINKYYYNYEDSILKIMNDYNKNYEVAKEMFKYLVFTNENNAKTEKLKNLLKIKNNLIENKSFKNYVKEQELIFVNIPHSKLLNEIGYFNNKEYLDNKNFYTLHKNITEEVIYVFEKISELINNGVLLNDIKIIYNDDYDNLIKRYAKFYSINMEEEIELNGTKILQDFLNNLDETSSFEKSFNLIKNKSIFKDKILKLINRSISSYDFNIQKEIFKKLAKNAKISIKYKEMLEKVDITYQGENKHIFILGFNDSYYPKIKKTKDYISEEEKNLLNIPNSSDEVIEQEEMFKMFISNNQNLYFSVTINNNYKLSRYIKFNFEEKEKEITNNIYSSLAHKLELSKKLDKYYKYLEKDKTLDKYYSSFNKEYNTYSNKYNGSIKITDPISLSYTSMNTYIYNPFAYYVERILKVSPYKDKFYMKTGSFFHKCLELEDYDEALKEFDFNNFDNEYVDRVKDEILIDIDFIKEYHKVNNFKDIKKEIDLVKNIGIDKFEGKLDKLIINKDTFIIFDYKKKISTASITIDKLNYGFNLQLPIYIYLVKNLYPNLDFGGVYLNYLILDNYKLTDKDKVIPNYIDKKNESLKFYGFTTSEIDRIEKVDNDYLSQKYLKNLSFTKTEEISKKSKILSDIDIKNIVESVDIIIKKVIEEIKNGKFDIINKKLNNQILDTQSNYLYKDISFATEEDILDITDKPYIDRSNNEI
ncbi:MAG: PD-(D/E)XK nuclease family protein [Clostridiales bacterium]|nr:PD-(D/E)XK nuclease family protein [Clostridiales bacterium]